MLVDRSGWFPFVAVSARIAPVGAVGWRRPGRRDCVIDHGAVLVSSGPPVVLGAGSVVMPNAVIRSAGGAHRPAFETTIGEDVLVGPLASLVGCTVEDAVYIATGVMVFQGAVSSGNPTHKGTPIMATQTKSTTPIADSVEHATERVVELNGKAAENGRKASAAYLNSYEKAVLSLADSYERAAGATRLDWVSSVASAQADFTREIMKAYTSAARELVR
jgi:hypothetical protein